jgi:hypothetical protein
MALALEALWGKKKRHRDESHALDALTQAGKPAFQNRWGDRQNFEQ